MTEIIIKDGSARASEGNASGTGRSVFGRGIKKATDQQLIDSYALTRSVVATGLVFGMCGQSVHERLVKLGKNRRRNFFTVDDENRLRREYAAHADRGKLADLAAAMGRTKPFIATQARRLGLTRGNRSKPYLSEIISARQLDWLKRNPHPRGMAGKVHTNAALDRMSQKSTARWHAMTKDQQIKFQSNSTRGWKSGWRQIGQHRKYFRSAWEANYARYLEWLRLRGEILDWEHEPETFWFEAIKRGNRSYLPDFKVTERNGRTAYHEVKGWMDSGSATKIRRMAKYHPHITLIVIDRKAYASIKKTMCPMIFDWETG